LPKLAENVVNGKNRIPLFVCFLSKKNNEDICAEYFTFSLVVHVYSTADDNKTLTVHRK
jgi:hypothetical protein